MTILPLPLYSFVIVQFTSFISHVSLFSITINSTFKFECFHLKVKYFISLLVKNGISLINKYSVTKEAIKYLSRKEYSQRSLIVHEYRDAVSLASQIRHQVHLPSVVV